MRHALTHHFGRKLEELRLGSRGVSQQQDVDVAPPVGAVRQHLGEKRGVSEEERRRRKVGGRGAKGGRCGPRLSLNRAGIFLSLPAPHLARPSEQQCRHGLLDLLRAENVGSNLGKQLREEGERRRKGAISQKPQNVTHVMFMRSVTGLAVALGTPLALSGQCARPF